MNKKLIVINLFAGPGAGKSTIRAGVFAKLKRLGFKVEEVTEYAKDKTWEDNISALSDPLYMLANQNRRLYRLNSKVDMVISDSPLLLSINYTPLEYLPQTFQNLVWELWDTYENINFFIRRTKAYQKFGRSQDEHEAIEIDDRIRTMLEEKGISYVEVKGDESGEATMVSVLSSIFLTRQAQEMGFYDNSNQVTSTVQQPNS